MNNRALFLILLLVIAVTPIVFTAIKPLFSEDKIEVYLYLKDDKNEPLEGAIVYIRVLPTPGGESKLFKTLKADESGLIHVTFDKSELFGEWRDFIKEKLGQPKITPFKISLMIDAIKFDGEYLYAIDGASIILDPLDTAYEKKVVYFNVNYVEKVNIASIGQLSSRALLDNNLKSNMPTPIYEERLVAYQEWSGIEVPILGFKADDNEAGDSTYDSDTFYGEAIFVVRSEAKKYFQIGLSVLSFQSDSWSYLIGGDSYYENRLDSTAPDFSTQSGSKVTHGYISFANCYIRWEKYITYVGGSPIREKHKVYLEYIDYGSNNNLLNVHYNEYPNWITNFTKSKEATYQGTGQYNNQWKIDDSKNPNKIVAMNLLAQSSISYSFTPIGYIIQADTGSISIPFPVDLGITWKEDYVSDFVSIIYFDAESGASIDVYLYSTRVEYRVGDSYYNLQLTFLDFDEVIDL